MNNEVGRICALYSHGPHYARVLRHLRRAYPDAVITALVPPGFPNEPLEGLAHKRLDLPAKAARRRGFAALRAILPVIRRGRYDLFVVMFDSFRLRLLAALSGARERRCFTADGRFIPLRLSLARLLAGTAWRNLRGRVTYWRIRWIVHHCPVEKKRG